MKIKKLLTFAFDVAQMLFIVGGFTLFFGVTIGPYAAMVASIIFFSAAIYAVREMRIESEKK